MLAELLILTPRGHTPSGEIVADHGIPSSTDDNVTIDCGTVTIPVQQHPISFIQVFISESFRHELELDGSIDDEGIKVEEDFVAQAILVELSDLTDVPTADQVTFRIITSAGIREVTIPETLNQTLQGEAQ